MPKGPPVPIMGIHLFRTGDRVVVEVQYPDGRLIPVMSEHWDGPFDHYIAEHGLAEQPPKTVAPVIGVTMTAAERNAEERAEDAERALMLDTEQEPRRAPQTHDYTRRCWGHNYTFTPRNAGLEASMWGWGRGISEGDYLILGNDEPGANPATRYRVCSIRYCVNPRDMWFAQVSFAPREASAA